MILHKLDHLFLMASRVHGSGKDCGGIVGQVEWNWEPDGQQVDIEPKQSQVVCNPFRNSFCMSFASGEKDCNAFRGLVRRLPPGLLKGKVGGAKGIIW
jgi:hypothetical protein